MPAGGVLFDAGWTGQRSPPRIGMASVDWLAVRSGANYQTGMFVLESRRAFWSGIGKTQ